MSLLLAGTTGCVAEGPTGSDEWSDYATPSCGGLFHAEAAYAAETGRPDPAKARLGDAFYAAGRRILHTDLATIREMGDDIAAEVLDDLRQSGGRGLYDHETSRTECLTFGAMLPETKGLLP
jgi:hypothetical protein